MRLLLLLPFPPRSDAADGGGRVTAQLIGRVASRHRVGVVCLRGPDEAPVDPQLRHACEFTEEIRRPDNSPLAAGLLARRARYLAGWLRGRPMWVTDWAVPDYAHRLRAILRDWAPEIVQAEFHVMGQYLPADSFSRAKRILVEHEPGICAATDVRRLGPALARLLPRLEMTAWRRYERALLNSAHVVVVFTNRDRQALSRLARKARFVTIPLGTDCPEHALDPIGTEPPQLLFIGNYNHPPNLDAARWLAECLFPAVQARVAGVRLTLVGDAPPPELRRLAGPSIRVTGRVPELSPYMAEAAVVVAPLRLGGGMRVKVLEALAAGKAVVASPLGAAGLDLTDGRELVLAHDGTQFVQRVVELLEQPERRREIGHNARSWALEHIGWDRPVALYEAVYEELLSEAGG